MLCWWHSELQTAVQSHVYSVSVGRFQQQGKCTCAYVTSSCKQLTSALQKPAHHCRWTSTVFHAASGNSGSAPKNPPKECQAFRLHRQSNSNGQATRVHLMGAVTLNNATAAIMAKARTHTHTQRSSALRLGHNMLATRSAQRLLC